MCIILCFYWQLGYGQSFIFNQPAVNVAINIKEMLCNDTITITAYLADCGEWGGHKERIVIVKKQTAVAYLDRDKPCTLNLSAHLINLFNDSTILNEETINLVSQYFKDFGEIATATDVFSNAPTEFWIKSKYKNYYRKDPVGKWEGFIILRDKLFKK